MATTTNYGWTTPDDTALVKDGAAAIRSLGTSIDTTVFNNASAGIAKTIVDAKGDLIAATASDTVARLAIGTNGQVLTADSAEATGMKWGTVAAGGMTLLSTTTLSGTSTTISSIPTGYKNLVAVFQTVQCNGNGDSIWFRINGIADASTYAHGMIRNSAGTISSSSVSSANTRGAFSFSVNQSTTYLKQNCSITFYNSSSTTTKYVESLSLGFNGTNVDASTAWCNHVSTAAITSLVFGVDGGTSFSNGSVLLYGVS